MLVSDRIIPHGMFAGHCISALPTPYLRLQLGAAGPAALAARRNGSRVAAAQ
jgi:hypothetical protein